MCRGGGWTDESMGSARRGLADGLRAQAVTLWQSAGFLTCDAGSGKAVGLTQIPVVTDFHLVQGSFLAQPHRVLSRNPCAPQS